jgi:hypothetical protein
MPKVTPVSDEEGRECPYKTDGKEPDRLNHNPISFLTKPFLFAIALYSNHVTFLKNVPFYIIRGEPPCQFILGYF